MDIININVGGTLFSTRLSTLKSLPDTRLGNLSTRSEEYIKEKGEKGYFFFDRNPDLFQSLLDLYRHGNLHVPSNICGATLKRELEFWQIPLNKIPNCCLAIFCRHEEAITSMENLKLHFTSEEEEAAHTKEPRKHIFYVLRHRLWLVLTARNSSWMAKVFNVVYYLLVILSVFLLIIETHPAFREPREDTIQDINYARIPLGQDPFGVNGTSNFRVMERNPKQNMYLTTQLLTPLKRLENSCTIFFALELILRLLCSPSIVRFFKSVLNLLDMIITVALLTVFALDLNSSLITSSESIHWLYIICNGMGVLRIVHLFRLTRDVGGIRVLTFLVKSKAKQLLTLGAFVLIALILFSSVMYYIELDKGDSSFTSIPFTIWWSIITVTTVGYGDATPSTAAGYIIGSLCAVCGILLVAMPVAIVATAYGDLSFLNQVREREVEIEENSKPEESRRGLKTKLIVNKIDVPHDI